MNWKQWVYGLVNAIVSSAANSVTAVVVDPVKFNLSSWEGFRNMSAMAGVGGLVGFWMYLKQSPLPALVEKTTTISEVTTVSEKAVDIPPKEKI